MTFLIAKQVVLALGMAAIAAIFALFGGGDWLGLLHPEVLLWLGWCLLPLVLLLASGRRDDPRPAAILMTVIAVAAGTYLYVDALVLNPDPQSPVAFAIVPMLQFMLILPGLAAFWWLRRRPMGRLG
jgi:FtsH-binding integral membrane protein